MKTGISKKPIYIIANAVIFPKRISGGDINFLELGKIWQSWGYPLYVVTTKEGKKMCLRHGLKAEFILLPTIPSDLFGTLLTYVFRSLIGPFVFLKYARPESIIFSSSDLTPDITPILLAKIKYPSIVWKISPNMIFPLPFKGYTKTFTKGYKFPSSSELLHFLAQQISVFLAKHFADQIITISRQMGNYFVDQKGFAKNKVVYAGYGVHIEKLKKLMPFKKNLYQGCFMGRFHSQKGLFDLLQIWQKVVLTLPQAKLVVIGGGSKSISQKFYQKIKDLGLSRNIKLMGFVFGEKRFRIVKSSQVFLFPSLFEGNPITIIEVMACHIPIAAYALPVFSQEYDNQGMVVAPPGNINRFSKQVIGLINSPRRQMKCIKNNDKVIANYDWPKAAQTVIGQPENDQNLMLKR